MLLVSDLLDVARGRSATETVSSGRPERFSRTHAMAPIIVWNVCRHCDMKCPHCYAAATHTPSIHDLDTKAGLALLENLARGGVKVVIFSGGEPLLRDDVLELIAHARDLGISPQLSTNGVHIDRGKAQALRAAGVGYVGVSIDGMPDFNDAYRGLDHAFDRASAGLAHAREAGMKTGVRITVTRRNAHFVEPLFAHACSIGVGRFYVSHLVDSGRALKIVGDDLAPSETRALLESLFELAWRSLDASSAPRVVTGGNDSDGPLLLRWVGTNVPDARVDLVRELLERRRGNSAGEGVLCVDARGDVHPDQFWRSLVLGNLATQTFADVLGHPFLAELRDREHRLTGRCGSCSDRGMCRGSHRERALARYDDVWASDPSCVLRDDEIGVAHVSH